MTKMLEPGILHWIVIQYDDTNIQHNHKRLWACAGVVLLHNAVAPLLCQNLASQHGLSALF